MFAGAVRAVGALLESIGEAVMEMRAAGHNSEAAPNEPTRVQGADMKP